MATPGDLDALDASPDRFKHVPRVSDAVVLNPLASGLCRARQIVDRPPGGLDTPPLNPERAPDAALAVFPCPVASGEQA